MQGVLRRAGILQHFRIDIYAWGRLLRADRRGDNSERGNCAYSDPVEFQPTHEQSPFDLAEAGSGLYSGYQMNRRSVVLRCIDQFIPRQGMPQCALYFRMPAWRELTDPLRQS